MNNYKFIIRVEDDERIIDNVSVIVKGESIITVYDSVLHILSSFSDYFSYTVYKVYEI